MHEARFAGTCQDQRGLSSQSLGGHLATSQGYGLGAGASRGLGPGLSLPPVFSRSEKSPGRAGEGVGDG